MLFLNAFVFNRYVSCNPSVKTFGFDSSLCYIRAFWQHVNDASYPLKSVFNLNCLDLKGLEGERTVKHSFLFFLQHIAHAHSLDLVPEGERHL